MVTLLVVSGPIVGIGSSADPTPTLSKVTPQQIDGLILLQHISKAAAALSGFVSRNSTMMSGETGASSGNGKGRR